ncbi:hypothetical protein H072_5197 [Dactylellina haptotyla CBS 200.50]|uniref:Uncharacterized protein n=1 Tax=Dactylellina haptotyla (strain CBS 200.50) TaxID=1284197 RepID=S8AD34_DACHA|nr:hypothetical protein H072_5197 [Dactylellina haptotyla CBS 200.50]
MSSSTQIPKLPRLTTAPLSSQPSGAPSQMRSPKNKAPSEPLKGWLAESSRNQPWAPLGPTSNSDPTKRLTELEELARKAGP